MCAPSAHATQVRATHLGGRVVLVRRVGWVQDGAQIQVREEVGLSLHGCRLLWHSKGAETAWTCWHACVGEEGGDGARRIERSSAGAAGARRSACFGASLTVPPSHACPLNLTSSSGHHCVQSATGFTPWCKQLDRHHAWMSTSAGRRLYSRIRDNTFIPTTHAACQHVVRRSGSAGQCVPHPMDAARSPADRTLIISNANVMHP